VVRPILVVSDLTHASDEALRAAARLAARSGAALHVVHCAGLVGMPLREALPRLECAPPALLSCRLGEQVRRAVPESQAARTVLRVEYRAVHDGAMEAARAVQAQLVVVGTDAMRSPLAALAAAADVPVLVVRDAAPPPFERVLVPLGAADLDAGTLRLACAWLRPFEGGAGAILPQVHVVHVSRRLADWRRIGDRFEAEVRAVEEDIRRMGGVFHRHVRWSGAAWPAIVAASRELDADLVVLRPGPGDAPDDRAGRTWTAVVEGARSNVLLLPRHPALSGPAGRVEAVQGPGEEHERTIGEPAPAGAELEPVPA
jgi:nucleotide-binding universal stress UspA family protein